MGRHHMGCLPSICACFEALGIAGFIHNDQYHRSILIHERNMLQSLIRIGLRTYTRDGSHTAVRISLSSPVRIGLHSRAVPGLPQIHTDPDGSGLHKFAELTKYLAQTSLYCGRSFPP